MFFLLSKIFEFVITPVVWIAFFMVLALFSKQPKRKKRSLITAILLFFFFSNAFIFNEFNRLWEIESRHYSELGKYDVGIVLGGYASYDAPKERVLFHNNSDRLWQTIELYKLGYVRKILICGGSGNLVHHDQKEADHVEKFLLRIGIPKRDILIERESSNTHENAAFAKDLLDKEYPDGKFLLITSATHMRRAKACFDKVELHTEIYPADKRTGPRKFFFDHMFIPNAGILSKWNMLTHEVAGYIIYWVTGYA